MPRMALQLNICVRTAVEGGAESCPPGAFLGVGESPSLDGSAPYVAPRLA